MLLDKVLDENVNRIKSMLPIGISFDIFGRYIDIGVTKGYLVFINGFVKDDIMVNVIRQLQKTKDEKIISAEELNLKNIPYIETHIVQEIDKIIELVLTGRIALIVDGIQDGIIIDARKYPGREPSESQIEKVTRGPRDDLVETIVMNTALIRRRIRDKRLTFEIKTVGSISKTDVAIGYLKGKADDKLVENLKNRIEKIKVPALTMGERSLEELLVKKKWYNPLPRFRVSERPDTIAAHLVEGHVVLMVDTSPTALITPTSLLYFTQYAEDYYQNPLAGTIIKFLRLIAFPITTLLVPLFLLLNLYPAELPQILKTFLPDTRADLSIFAQLIYLEIGLEILQLSTLHTQKNLEAAFSIIAGLILGDIAITMGLFVPDALFFTVASTIANHCIPNPEMANALKVFRWFLLFATGFFGIWGFAVGFIIITIITCRTDTFDKKHGYLWPLIPFNAKALKHLMFCYPLGILDGKSDSDE